MKLIEYLNLQKSEDPEFTIKKFAKKVGCHFCTISRLAHGKRMPSRRLAFQIEKFTGGAVSFMELFSNVGNIDQNQCDPDYV